MRQTINAMKLKFETKGIKRVIRDPINIPNISKYFAPNFAAKIPPIILKKLNEYKIFFSGNQKEVLTCVKM